VARPSFRIEALGGRFAVPLDTPHVVPSRSPQGPRVRTRWKAEASGEVIPGALPWLALHGAIGEIRCCPASTPAVVGAVQRKALRPQVKRGAYRLPCGRGHCYRGARGDPRAGTPLSSSRRRRPAGRHLSTSSTDTPPCTGSSHRIGQSRGPSLRSAERLRHSNPTVTMNGDRTSCRRSMNSSPRGSRVVSQSAARCCWLFADFRPG
jgi:hypothetical protein